MSEHSFLAISGRTWVIPGWMPAVALLAGTAVIGPELGSLSRPLFVVLCGFVGWYAWKSGPGVHLQAALILFSFAPLVRRMVDLSAGYDSTGLMLVGPLLTILAPVPQLRALLEGGRSLGRQTAPMLIVAGCVCYAAMLSLLQGDWMNVASGSLKWLAPLLYAAALCESADCDELIEAATSAFVTILPVVGIIGIFQYINPPDWDRYWMQFAPITSVGQPIPYGVRIFSTMNGPATFATFTAAGLLLVCFLRSDWLSLTLVTPAALSLLLSQYRTAWLSLAGGILLCLCFAATRRRAGLLLFGALVVAVVAASIGPFAETIGDRLQTLSQGSQDGSLQERLEQFVAVWSQWESSPFGIGFTTTDVGAAGAMPVDGLIIFCWISMGLVVGLFCLTGLIWAATNTVAVAWREGRKEAVIVGAIGCGAFIQLPLANIASGELGFLFWTFAAMASSDNPRAMAYGAT